MPHRFVIKVKGQCCTYDRYEDIPAEFDHVIEFLPEIPPEPHTPEQHREIEAWSDRFDRLLEIEHARSSQTR